MVEMRVAELNRHPVKGLSPEALIKVELETGGYFPGDRLYAIENGPSGFDPDNPTHLLTHLPKMKFLMLMKQGRLAALSTKFDDRSTLLTISLGGRERIQARLADESGREAVAAFLADYCKGELRGPPKVIVAPRAYRFTDSLRSGFVSLINVASLADLSKTLGRPVEAARFRANVVVEGPSAWNENDWVGKILAGPGVRLRVLKRIERCAATNVEPGTGDRNLDLVRTMAKVYGHIDCGVYAETIEGGTLACGDILSVAES